MARWYSLLPKAVHAALVKAAEVTPPGIGVKVLVGGRRVGVEDDLGVDVDVFVGVDVGVLVKVAVGVEVGAEVGVFVAVEVGVSVYVAVAVGMGVGVLVGVGVGISVPHAGSIKALTNRKMNSARFIEILPIFADRGFYRLWPSNKMPSK